MAQVINLREDEYQTILLELEKMHTNQLQSIANVIIEMKDLVTSEDVFSANQTSKKIENMLYMLSSDIMTLLEQVFHDSGVGFCSMIKNTIMTDCT